MRPDLYTRPKFWIGHGDPQSRPAWGKLRKLKSIPLLESRRGVGAINLAITLTQDLMCDQTQPL